jgi:hypothetical protein
MSLSINTNNHIPAIFNTEPSNNKPSNKKRKDIKSMKDWTNKLTRPDMYRARTRKARDEQLSDYRYGNKNTQIETAKKSLQDFAFLIQLSIITYTFRQLNLNNNTPTSEE